MNSDRSKVSEWVDKLYQNALKCASWISEVKDQVQPHDHQQIRNILELLVDLLPSDR